MNDSIKMPTACTWGAIVNLDAHWYASRFPDKPTELDRQEAVFYAEKVVPRKIGCGFCSSHYKKFLEKNPIYPATENRNKLENWFIDLHESINDNKSIPKEKRHDREVLRDAYRKGTWSQLKWDFVCPSESQQQIKVDEKKLKNQVEQNSLDPQSNTILIVVITILIVMFIELFIFLVYRSVKKSKE